MKKIFLIMLILSLFSIVIAMGIGEISRTEAQQALMNAEDLIQEMKSEGLSTNSVTDLLKEANASFERAKFAELIANNVSGTMSEEASKTLKRLNYTGFSYSEVLIYTTQIKEKRDLAFSLYDQLLSLKIKTTDYSQEGINVTTASELIKQADSYFMLERYDETKNLLEQINQNLESQKAEEATARIIINSSKNFFIKYGKEMLILLLALGIVFWYGWQKLTIKHLKNNLDHLKKEKIALKLMMKKTQQQHFNQRTLSQMVYNVRMKKYSERLNELNHQLPVIRAELHRKINKDKK